MCNCIAFVSGGGRSRWRTPVWWWVPVFCVVLPSHVQCIPIYLLVFVFSSSHLCKLPLSIISTGFINNYLNAIFNRILIKCILKQTTTSALVQSRTNTCLSPVFSWGWAVLGGLVEPLWLMFPHFFIMIFSQSMSFNSSSTLTGPFHFLWTYNQRGPNIVCLGPA